MLQGQYELLVQAAELLQDLSTSSLVELGSSRVGCPECDALTQQGKWVVTDPAKAGPASGYHEPSTVSHDDDCKLAAWLVTYRDAVEGVHVEGDFTSLAGAASAEKHMKKLVRAFFSNLQRDNVCYGGIGLDSKRPFGTSGTGRIADDILAIVGVEPEGEILSDGSRFPTPEQEGYAHACYDNLIPYLRVQYGSKS